MRSWVGAAEGQEIPLCWFLGCKLHRIYYFLKKKYNIRYCSKNNLCFLDQATHSKEKPHPPVLLCSSRKKKRREEKSREGRRRRKEEGPQFPAAGKEEKVERVCIRTVRCGVAFFLLSSVRVRDLTLFDSKNAWIYFRKFQCIF